MISIDIKLQGGHIGAGAVAKGKLVTRRWQPKVAATLWVEIIKTCGKSLNKKESENARADMDCQILPHGTI